MHDSYVIKGDSSPEYIKNIAAYVDQELKQIKKRNYRVSQKRIMILALMNMVDRYFRERDKSDGLKVDYQQLKRERNKLSERVSSLEEELGRRKE